MRLNTKLPALLVIVTIGAFALRLGAAFSAPVRRSRGRSPAAETALCAYNTRQQRGREKTKRQQRVGQLVQTELGRIIHTGIVKGGSDYLDDDLRKRISIVGVDVSPDLRQARVSTSIRGSSLPGHQNAAVDKRRAYSWLVKNTVPLRHTLAQKMSHMKTSPALTFVQVDVSAAVDVMYLIDKVSSGYGRKGVGEFGGDDNSLPRGFIDDMDFDEEFDDEDWDEEDGDFFDLDENDE